MHVLVDTVSGIPLAHSITPANIADIDLTEPLMQKLIEDYGKSLAQKYYIMDTGYDKPDQYSSIYTTIMRW